MFFSSRGRRETPKSYIEEIYGHKTKPSNDLSLVLWIPKGGSIESYCHPHSTGTCRRSFLGRARQQAEDIGIVKETITANNSHGPHLVHWPPECSLLQRVGGGSLAGDTLEDVHAARVARHLHRLAQLRNMSV